MARLRWVTVGFLVVLCASSVSAATLTVDSSGGAEYTDIQSAIDAAADGDTVLVKPGEYAITEPINFNRLHDPADPASPPVKDIVVKSEGGSEATAIRMGTPTDAQRASVVAFEGGEGPGSVLEGFRITGGRGRRSIFVASSCGGGILCQNSSPRIVSCRIVRNSADTGGGLCSYGASPTISGCTITENGGGLYFLSSSPEVSGCTITRNAANQGAIVLASSSGSIRDCTIAGNHGEWGGGVSCSGAGSPAIERCSIVGNQAITGAGLLVTWDATPVVLSCTIAGNAGASAVFSSYLAEPVFANCTIAGNRVDKDVLYREDAGSYTLRNCIVWGNAPDDEFRCFGCADHCSIGQDPEFVGEGTFDFNLFDTDVVPGSDVPIPNFIVEPPDYHLQPGSPCIDAGITEGAATTDIEGHGRPCGGGVDIGAYESGGCAASGTRFVRGNADAAGGIDISDPIFLLTYLFIGGSAPDCLDAADINDDGSLDLSDAVYSLIFQFLGGFPPRSPYPECGTKDRINGLDCRSYPGCQ
jgi:parallel beta-helix repeat protein